MHEPQDAPLRLRRVLPGLVIIVLSAATLLGWLQTATEGLYGYDGYFHIRYAQILRTEGISRTFPWWQETFLREHYADKDFLYHILLIPFTFFDLVAGGKIAAVVFGSLSIGVFYLVACRLKAPWPEAWTFLLMASSTVFLYRLGFNRPLVLAVAMSLAGTCAILLEREKWAFLLAALYPHAHISFHLLPCVALLHDLHREVPQGGARWRRFRLTAWTLPGAVVGALVSPYVPNNLYLWWIQNVRVLGMAWGGPPDLRLGGEIMPGQADQLLKYDIGVFAALAAAVYILARNRRRASAQALTLLVLSAGFLALSMMSRRFIEFWAPFTVLLAAVAARDAIAPAIRPEGSASPAATRRRSGSVFRWVAASAAAIAVAAMLWFSATSARKMVAQDEGLYYAGASEWMQANIPAGETIFHLDWDDFPQLFYFNAQFHYLVGLDPTFMYLTDPARWRLWSDVAHRNADDIYTPIRETFHSRWVFAIPEAEDFLKAARRDPRFSVRYEDSHATLFELADGYAFVKEWKITGWYPDPARRLFDVPLGPEPGAERGSIPEPLGPAAEGAGARTDSGFLDLDQVAGLTTVARDACCVAQTILLAESASIATLTVTSDDEFRVSLNGAPVLEHSPYRTPPPGLPGGPVASLDEFLESQAHVPERSAAASLRAGGNDLVVKVCRAGEDFGFFLRAYFEGGGPVRSAAPAGTVWPATKAP